MDSVKNGDCFSKNNGQTLTDVKKLCMTVRMRIEAQITFQKMALTAR